jgi:glycosyltransferase involved in cell wall biosynthesis
MQSIKQNNSSEKKWCVIIPTFNNDKTLEKVLKEALSICKNIIVVNDGSDDNTSRILKNFSDTIDIITHKENRGKGKSLRDAFEYAIKKDFEYGITIDSDGQHYPADINLFVEAIAKYPDSIIVGARDMDQDGIPKKSSFGNKFSNFWFWTETGISLSDTQTGFRLYPLNKMTGMRFFTGKFEFEIEVMVRMAWKDVLIKEIPIRVKYDEKERISHFRPFKDFTRISILNTVLFIIALLYYIPLRGLYFLFGKERIKNIKKEFFSQEGTLLQKSISIGFGVFMGIVPIWGFQMLAALFLSYIFRLNKVIVLLFSNISIPPLIPFILFGSYYAGHLVIGGEKLIFSTEINLAHVQSVLKQYLIGSVIFALFLGFAFFVFSYLFTSLYKLISKNEKIVL